MIEAYVNATWRDVPDDYLKWPEDINSSERNWLVEFCNINDLYWCNSIGHHGSMSNVEILSTLDLTKPCDYPYVVFFDFMGEGRPILCPNWKDVMRFLNDYCLICLHTSITDIASSMENR